MCSAFLHSGFHGAFIFKDLSEGFIEEKRSGRRKALSLKAMLNSGQEPTEDAKAESDLYSTQIAGGSQWCE